MHMTPAQLATLKADILANPDALAIYNIGDLTALAALYNALASPVFTVWKTNVKVEEIGDNIVGTELDGLTSLKLQRLQAIIALSANGVNPSLSDRRAFFDQVFAGTDGTLTRPKLDTLWRRSARRIEKLFSTGTGSVAVPATMIVEGLLTVNDLIGL